MATVSYMTGDVRRVALRILTGVLGHVPASLRRERHSHSGNVVYSASLQGKDYVLRMNETPKKIAPSLGNIPLLGALGNTVQRVMASDLSCRTYPYGWMVVTRLPGRDLLFAYPTMTTRQLRALAREIAKVQDSLTRSTPPKKFGRLEGGWEDQKVRKGLPTWYAFVRHEIRSLQDTALARELLHIVARKKQELLAIRPGYFLEDLTTKNVLVHEGRYSGMIDIDWMDSGDRRHWLGFLTSCLHVDMPGDLRYRDMLMEEFGYTKQDRVMVDLYTALSLPGSVGWVRTKQEKERLKAELTKLLHSLRS